MLEDGYQRFRGKTLPDNLPYFLGPIFVEIRIYRDIANFLRIYGKDLDPQSIGEFLSEPDVKDVSMFSLFFFNVCSHSVCIELPRGFMEMYVGGLKEKGYIIPGRFPYLPPLPPPPNPLVIYFSHT